MCSLALGDKVTRSLALTLALAHSHSHSLAFAHSLFVFPIISVIGIFSRVLHDSIGRYVGRSVSRSVGRLVCLSVTQLLFDHFLIVLSVIMSIQSVIKSIQSVIKKIQLNLVSFSLIFTSRLIATAPTRDWCHVYGLVSFIFIAFHSFYVG